MAEGRDVENRKENVEETTHECTRVNSVCTSTTCMLRPYLSVSENLMTDFKCKELISMKTTTFNFGFQYFLKQIYAIVCVYIILHNFQPRCFG
jgi:hypothetical protein